MAIKGLVALLLEPNVIITCEANTTEGNVCMSLQIACETENNPWLEKRWLWIDIISVLHRQKLIDYAYERCFVARGENTKPQETALWDAT